LNEPRDDWEEERCRVRDGGPHESNRPEEEKESSPHSSGSELLLSPLAVEGEKAFARDLPQLLQERSGQWVGYHGDKLFGFARTSTELYDRWRSSGIPEDDFIVHRIEAETAEEKIPPFAVDVELSQRHLLFRSSAE
jgi:hypothetical protein